MLVQHLMQDVQVALDICLAGTNGCEPFQWVQAPRVDLDWAEAMLCSAIELGRRVQDKSILRVPQNQELQLLRAAHPSGVRGLTPMPSQMCSTATGRNSLPIH